MNMESILIKTPEDQPEDLDVISDRNREAIVNLITDSGKKIEKKQILNDYLEFLKKVNENPKNIVLSEVQKKVNELISNEIFPLRTIPIKAWDEIQKAGSMRAMPTDEVGSLELLAGTIGIDPFIGSDDGERVLVEVKCEPGDVSPRTAGPKNIFQGTVYFNGRYRNNIPLEAIKVLGKVNVDGKYGDMELYNKNN